MFEYSPSRSGKYHDQTLHQHLGCFIDSLLIPYVRRLHRWQSYELSDILVLRYVFAERRQHEVQVDSQAMVTACHWESENSVTGLHVHFATSVTSRRFVLEPGDVLIQTCLMELSVPAFAAASDLLGERLEAVWSCRDSVAFQGAKSGCSLTVSSCEQMPDTRTKPQESGDSEVLYRASSLAQYLTGRPASEQPTKPLPKCLRRSEREFVGDHARLHQQEAWYRDLTPEQTARLVNASMGDEKEHEKKIDELAHGSLGAVSQRTRTLAGCVFASFVDETLNIGQLKVDRSHKLGASISTVKLTVLESNDSAQRCYAKSGFKVCTTYSSSLSTVCLRSYTNP